MPIPVSRLPGITVDHDPDGRKERVQFDKITARVSRLCYGLDSEHVDPLAITMKVINGVYQGVTTIQLDDLVSGLKPVEAFLPAVTDLFHVRRPRLRPI